MCSCLFSGLLVSVRGLGEFSWLVGVDHRFTVAVRKQTCDGLVISALTWNFFFTAACGRCDLPSPHCAHNLARCHAATLGGAKLCAEYRETGHNSGTKPQSLNDEETRDPLYRIMRALKLTAVKQSSEHNFGRRLGSDCAICGFSSHRYLTSYANEWLADSSGISKAAEIKFSTFLNLGF